MKIVVAGGTGFIGHSLVRRLKEKEHSIIVLTRRAKVENKKNVRYLHWDGKNVGGWVAELEGVDAIINLAGENIAQGRWTNEKKERIRSSRIHSTRAIVEAIRSLKQKPQVLLNASAVGFYGNVQEGEVTESSTQGSDFLAHVCGDWEKEAHAAQELGVRTVILRFGVVLSARGGALRKMLTPFRFFLGGPLGNGNQWFPWISRRDVRRAIQFVMEKKEISGPVNIVAPESVTMYQFCKTLGTILGRPSVFRVPEWLCQIMFGEVTDVLLKGQRALPKKLLDAGFRFRFPTLYEALASTLRHYI